MNTMKFRMLFGVAAALACMLFASCAKDVIDLTGSIKGVVKDERGNLMEDCMISITPTGTAKITGVDGSFEFTKLDPGDYTITVKKEGYTNTTLKVSVISGKEVNADVVLKYSYGGIKGTVKDAMGLVEGCLVSLSPGGQSVLTSTNGAFEFTKLSPGEYTICFKKEGYADNIQNIVIVAGETINVDVALGNSYGGIKGVVRDETDNHFIENCLVSISPGGIAVTTSSNGLFEFKNLVAGDYTLNLKKTGYPDKFITTSVVKGQVTNVDVQMKLDDPISFSESELDYGDFETTKTFTLFNNSDGGCTFAISNIPTWLSLSQTNGSVGKLSRTTIVATANRDKIEYGTFVQNLIISYSGRVTGEAMIKVSIEKVLLTTPEVTIYASAENVTETSFDIKGNIVSTGGSQILDYGHCWSTKEHPTTNDNCTRLGQRNELGGYASSITGLMTSSTYYVCAYARNAQGTTYSEQITVNTQDPYNDKWDGNIASGYAGGSGTIVDPYIIKTGGQLLYAFKQGKGYLKLANDIDLNNHNWKPYSFNGSFDGDGHTISNLYINRTDNEPCGLVRNFYGGEISNLTIRGVNIKSTYDNTGAIAGSGGTLSNCHLVLTSGSKIEGCEYVGGLIGYGSHTKITNCSVTSLDSETYIYGTEYVGGICGRSVEATDCHVSCNIYGGSCVGGIVGIYGSVEDCFFQGNINGETEVGGIMGFADNSKIIACKVVANIEGEEYVGGICGWGGSQNGNITIIACYSDGHIQIGRAHV